MDKQATNNGYTRCSECSEVYSSELPECPKCGKKNPSHVIDENSRIHGNFIAENMGMVFNIID